MLKEVIEKIDNGIKVYYEDDNGYIQGHVMWFDNEGNIKREYMTRNGSIHGVEVKYDALGIRRVCDVYIDGSYHANYSDLSQADKDTLSNEHGIIWFNDIDGSNTFILRYSKYPLPIL